MPSATDEHRSSRMDRETVIATVQKLLNVTVDRGATEAEQANAAAAAQRLLLKYGLSMQEVAQTVETPFVEGTVPLSTRTVPSWIATLAEGIQTFFGVKAFHLYRRINRESSQLVFVGEPVGVKLGTWLFEKVKKDIYAGCLREISTVKHLPPKDRKSFQASFLEAAALTVSLRMIKARRDALRSNPTANALVVQSEAAILKYVEDLGGTVGKAAETQKPALGSIDGLMAGRRVGSEISIATNAVEADERKLLQA